jgi:hypothetical protein
MQDRDEKKQKEKGKQKEADKRVRRLSTGLTSVLMAINTPSLHLGSSHPPHTISHHHDELCLCVYLSSVDMIDTTS